MLVQLAWRNIWRNKPRSLTLMLSVAVGLWAGMFIMSFSWGLYKEQVRDVIGTQLSHLQIHHPEFMQERLAGYTVPDGETTMEWLQKDPRVKGVSSRNRSDGMISSPSYAAGVTVFGIHPAEERKVSVISQDIIQGNYFPGVKKNELLIGEKLAEKLGARIKSKVVLTVQSKSGDITAGAFRIAGIFRTRSSVFDENTVYANFPDLASLLGTGDGIHEIAILLKEDAQSDILAKELKEKSGDLQIQTWKELAPELQLIVDSFNQYMYIFIGIILMALMFGIVNTMLMAVLERQREFGVLMAIGMNRTRVFSMIQLETIFLSCAGIPLGLLLAFTTIGYFNRHGIDFSMFSKGLAQYGFTTVIHPEIEPQYYFSIAGMTAVFSILTAIYPAIRALKLKPNEAIRKI